MGDVAGGGWVVLVVVGAVVAVVEVVGLVVLVGPDVEEPGVLVLGVVSPGAGSLNGTGAFGPPTTYTGVPLGTAPGNQADAYIGMRTHPCEAGYAGTEGAPWMAMPPLKYSGLYSFPSLLVRQPETRRVTRKEPPGVTARAHSPSTQ